MPTDYSFHFAFNAWRRSCLDDWLAVWAPPTYERNLVRLTLKTFDPHVVAEIGRDGATIWVEHDYLSWGTLAAWSLDAERTDSGGYRCRLTEHQPDSMIGDAITIEEIWTDILFRPVLHFGQDFSTRIDVLYRCEHPGGEGWVEPGSRGDLPPEHVRYAIFSHPMREAA